MHKVEQPHTPFTDRRDRERRNGKICSWFLKRGVFSTVLSSHNGANNATNEAYQPPFNQQRLIPVRTNYTTRNGRIALEESTTSSD
jgi:hypothetical protein